MGSNELLGSTDQCPAKCRLMVAPQLRNTCQGIPEQATPTKVSGEVAEVTTQTSSIIRNVGEVGEVTTQTSSIIRNVENVESSSKLLSHKT